MILCYLLIFLFFNLIKTAAKFMRTESVKCPARAVFAKSRARHVHIMSLNLLTSHKSPLIKTNSRSISRVSFVHSPRTTDESLLLSENQALPTSNSSLYCTQELKPLDISYEQIFFFAKIYTNFEIRRRVPRVKKQQKLTKFNKNTHTYLSLSLSLSLSTCRSADGMFTLMCLHQSLSLSTFANTVWIQIRPEWYSGNLKMCACGGKYAKR